MNYFQYDASNLSQQLFPSSLQNNDERSYVYNQKSIGNKVKQLNFQQIRFKRPDEQYSRYCKSQNSDIQKKELSPLNIMSNSQVLPLNVKEFQNQNLKGKLFNSVDFINERVIIHQEQFSNQIEGDIKDSQNHHKKYQVNFKIFDKMNSLYIQDLASGINGKTQFLKSFLYFGNDPFQTKRFYLTLFHMIYFMNLLVGFSYLTYRILLEFQFSNQQDTLCLVYFVFITMDLLGQMKNFYQNGTQKYCSFIKQTSIDIITLTVLIMQWIRTYDQINFVLIFYPISIFKLILIRKNLYEFYLIVLVTFDFKLLSISIEICKFLILLHTYICLSSYNILSTQRFNDKYQYLNIITFINGQYNFKKNQPSVAEIINLVILIFLICQAIKMTVRFLDLFHLERSHKQLNIALKNQNFPKKLKLNIAQSYIYTKKSLKQYQSQQNLINTLPKYYKNRIKEQCFLPMMKKIQFLNQSFSEKTFKSICSHIAERFLMIDQSLELDKRNQNLIFVIKGSLNVYEVRDKRKIFLGSIHSGQLFGIGRFFQLQEQINLQLISTNNSIIGILDKKDFIQTMQALPMEYEKFLMILNQVIQLELTDQMSYQCIACGRINHEVKSCYLLHYLPMRDQILKDHLHSQDQLRIKYQRQQRRKFNPKKNFNDMQKKAKEFQENENQIDFSQEESFLIQSSYYPGGTFQNYSEINSIEGNRNLYNFQKNILNHNKSHPEEFVEVSNDNSRLIELQPYESQQNLLPIVEDLDQIKERYMHSYQGSMNSALLYSQNLPQFPQSHLSNIQYGLIKENSLRRENEKSSNLNTFMSKKEKEELFDLFKDYTKNQEKERTSKKYLDKFNVNQNNIQKQFSRVSYVSNTKTLSEESDESDSEKMYLQSSKKRSSNINQKSFPSQRYELIPQSQISNQDNKIQSKIQIVQSQFTKNNYDYAFQTMKYPYDYFQYEFYCQFDQAQNFKNFYPNYNINKITLNSNVSQRNDQIDQGTKNLK